MAKEENKKVKWTDWILIAIFVILFWMIYTVLYFESRETDEMERNGWGIQYRDGTPYCGRWVTETEDGITRHFRSWCSI